MAAAVAVCVAVAVAVCVWVLMCLCVYVGGGGWVVVVVCCFLFSEVKFLDMLKDELPQNHLPRMLSLITNESKGIEDINRRRLIHKPCRLDIFSSTFNKYVACLELDIRPNSLRSLILRYTVSLEKGGVTQAAQIKR